MGDWPTDGLPTLPCVTPFSPEAFGGSLLSSGSAAAGSAALSSQVARFFPWTIEIATLIVKGFCLNGTTATGNTDVGVYDHEFNLIVASGATAQSGTSVIQEFDITDTWLDPGRYWMAIVNSSTGTAFARSIADEIMLGTAVFLVQTGQSSLPSPASPSRTTEATVIMPIFGFSTSTVI